MLENQLPDRSGWLFGNGCAEETLVESSREPRGRCRKGAEQDKRTVSAVLDPQLGNLVIAEAIGVVDVEVGEDLVHGVGECALHG